MASIGLYTAILGPQLVELFEKDQVQPCWKRCDFRQALRVQKPILFPVSSVPWLLFQHVSSQLLLQCHTCLPSVMLPVMMALDSLLLL